jgi:hypothetical protein
LTFQFFRGSDINICRSLTAARSCSCAALTIRCQPPNVLVTDQSRPSSGRSPAWRDAAMAAPDDRLAGPGVETRFSMRDRVRTPASPHPTASARAAAPPQRARRNRIDWADVPGASAAAHGRRDRPIRLSDVRNTAQRDEGVRGGAAMVGAEALGARAVLKTTISPTSGPCGVPEVGPSS